jgi:acyl-CoA synthetase (AMP-forming)/AMP-acid ligase II
MIVRSTLPELTVPNTDFSTFALERARQLPNKPAIVDADSGETITYGALTEAIDATAGGLAAHGLRPGDVVAVCGFNSPGFAVAVHAIWRAGGTVTTLNPLLTVGEMVHELADAGARYYLIAASEVTERAVEAAGQCGLQTIPTTCSACESEPGRPPDSLGPSSIVKEVFTVGEGEVGLGMTSITPLASGLHPPPGLAADPAEDTALILHSSGTTGLPKGVMLTHYNLMASLLQLRDADAGQETDVLAAIPPFFHIAGLHGIVNLGFFVGATIVTMRRFALERFLALVQEHRISNVLLVPPVLNALTSSPAVADFDVSSLRLICCVAAPLSAEAERAAENRLGCVVKQGYGQTEVSGPATWMPSDPSKLRHGSVGLPPASTQIRIVDVTDGRELGPQQAGEVLVRGPQVMKGYLNQPEATASTIDSDGWLHTGDIGFADDDGYLYIVDRLKELIKYKGYQVAPAELEAVLGTHPAVADAAVVPSPDAEAGEIPKAFVVLRSEASADDVLGFVAERVAPYKKVRALEVVDSIPKSPSGKILRRMLVERERATVGAKG